MAILHIMAETSIGEALLRVLTMQDHNTRVVMLGTTLLGMASGLIGTFLLLRKRALMGDALSHATLPGIGLAFMLMVAFGGSGKSMPGLLVGAAISGVLGLGCVLVIRHHTRLKEDAALGIVLSVFFGIGIALLGVIQKMGTGHAAGLESFIYGKTASMLAADAKLIAVAAVAVAVACGLLFKEFTLLCFDEALAGAQGWPTILLDALMLVLVVLVTVIGLQAVGLMLMIALLVIPPAAARFWSNHLPTLVLISVVFGAISGFVGAGLSAVVPRLPAGAIIVVVAGVLFVISLVFGSARGALVRWLDHWRVTRNVTRQHLLRALFEWCEQTGDAGASADGLGHAAAPLPWLLAERSWTPRQLRRALARARDDGLARSNVRGDIALTESGWHEARRMVRNHRLWELYLITHADIAPSHVDRDADQLEHVLGASMVGKLESLLAGEHPHLAVPPSPHRLRGDSTNEGERGPRREA